MMKRRQRRRQTIEKKRTITTKERKKKRTTKTKERNSGEEKEHYFSLFLYFPFFSLSPLPLHNFLLDLFPSIIPSSIIPIFLSFFFPIFLFPATTKKERIFAYFLLLSSKAALIFSERPFSSFLRP